MVAVTNEFGATIDRAPSKVTVYRSSKGGGRFVKRKLKTAVAFDYDVGAYQIVIPPRPFFRNMIKKNAPTWGDAIGKILKATKYDVAQTLGDMGARIQRQLMESIDAMVDPKNADSTIAKKKFSKPLIDSGKMRNSVAFEVKS